MMKVLVADPDVNLQRVLHAMVRSADLDLEPVVVPDAASAWSAIASDPAVRIALVGAEHGLDFCQRVRAELDDSYRYLLLLAGRPRHQDLVEALAAGADEVLFKPIVADELRAHLAVAARLLARGASSRSVLHALREAAVSPGGEVVVRSGEQVSRVFFHGGRVAWVQVPGRTLSPSTLLGAGAASSKEALVDLIDECKRTGAPFDEVLAARGLVAPELLRARLGAWLASGLDELVAQPSPEVLFLPTTRAFAGRQTFALEELLPAAAQPSSAPASPPRLAKGPVRRLSSTSLAVLSTACFRPHGPCVGCGADAASTLDELFQIDGVVGAAIVNRPSGRMIASAGLSPDADIVRAELQIAASLRAGGDSALEDVLVSTRTTYHLLHATPCADALICVVAERPRAALGPLRFAVARVAAAVAQR